jgi:hypothetical protein
MIEECFNVKFHKLFRTVVHYAQEVNSKQFSAYDHGHKENQASYIKSNVLFEFYTLLIMFLTFL